MTFTVFVTPSSHEDLKRYLEEIRGFYGHLTDADAKRFSSNGVFAVHGLWTDGANVIYKEIC